MAGFFFGGRAVEPGESFFISGKAKAIDEGAGAAGLFSDPLLGKNGGFFSLKEGGKKAEEKEGRALHGGRGGTSNFQR